MVAFKSSLGFALLSAVFQAQVMADCCAIVRGAGFTEAVIGTPSGGIDQPKESSALHPNCSYQGEFYTDCSIFNLNVFDAACGTVTLVDGGHTCAPAALP